MDELLGNGIRTGVRTQVYGPPGSGKTNIALQACVNCIRLGKKVVFIDTEGSFNIKRVEQIAGNDFKKVIENTYLFEPNSFKEQMEIIEQLIDSIDKNVGLVVVDSMVYYYRLEFDRENPYDGSRMLGLQLSKLLEIARKRKVAVLVTNQVYTNIDNGHMEPVGGDVMKYASKIILKLDNNGERTAELVKHQFLKEGQKRTFRIVGSGIV